MTTESWAILEIMGHQRIAGKVREVARAGVQMLEVEVPEMDGKPAYVRRFAGAAIFSETPVPEPVALEFLRCERWSMTNPLMLVAPPGDAPPDAEVVVCADCETEPCFCDEATGEDLG